MGLRKGDIIKSRSNGIEGIIVEFKKAEYNSYYHKAVIFCTLAPYNPAYVGTLLHINLSHCRKVTRSTDFEYTENGL